MKESVEHEERSVKGRQAEFPFMDDLPWRTSVSTIQQQPAEIDQSGTQYWVIEGASRRGKVTLYHSWYLSLNLM